MGIEKLKNMRREMEEERIREEMALNERLKNDVVRAHERDLKKQKKPPLVPTSSVIVQQKN